MGQIQGFSDKQIDALTMCSDNKEIYAIQINSKKQVHVVNKNTEEQVEFLGYIGIKLAINLFMWGDISVLPYIPQYKNNKGEEAS